MAAIIEAETDSWQHGREEATELSDALKADVSSCFDHPSQFNAITSLYFAVDDHWRQSSVEGGSFPLPSILSPGQTGGEL